MNSLRPSPGSLRMLFVGWLAFLPCLPAAGADPSKPVAVLSIASIDQLMNDFAYFTNVAGKSEIGGFIELAAAGFLQELDRTKPMGVLITIREDEPQGVGFLAVRDLDKLLRLARDKFAIDVDSLGNGIQKLEVGQGVYLAQQDGWLYFSDHPQHLAILPVDPVAALEGLDQQYSVALRLSMQNIPQNLRDLVAFQLHAQIDLDLREAPIEDPEIDGPFLESLRRGLKQTVNTVLQETDQVTVGWAVDIPGRRMHVDVHATAIPGSDLRNALTELANPSPTLRGLVVPEAAMTFHAATSISPRLAGAIRIVVEYLRTKSLHGIDRDPQAPAALKEIVQSVLDMVERTADGGAAEMAASLVVVPKTFRFVTAARVADGQLLGEAMQRLFELARHEPDVPEVKFFADKHRDVDLHTLTVPIAQRDQDARKVLGDELEMVIGTAPQSVYVALGQGCDQLIRQVLDAPPAAQANSDILLEVRLAAKPLLAFLASLDATDDKPRRMAEVIAQARGGDRVAWTVSALENGLAGRFEVEEGVLEMLARTAPTTGRQE